MRRSRVVSACCVAVLGLVMAGCARQPEPLSANDALPLRQRCPEGTFMGTMTSNCPTIVR